MVFAVPMNPQALMPPSVQNIGANTIAPIIPPTFRIPFLSALVIPEIIFPAPAVPAIPASAYVVSQPPCGMPVVL